MRHLKSTLEEAKYADYIIHVVDASNPQRDKQMYIVYETLDHLGVKNKKILTLFNKIDIRTDDDPLQDFRADHVLQISAAENAGLDAVKDVLQEMLREDKIYIERVIPYAQAGVLQLVRNKGRTCLRRVCAGRNFHSGICPYGGIRKTVIAVCEIL